MQFLKIKTNIYRCGGAKGLGELSPTFRSRGLISKIAPHFLCPKIFCRALFGAIREITVQRS